MKEEESEEIDTDADSNDVNAGDSSNETSESEE
jgi:hypothetical protein